MTKASDLFVQALEAEGVDHVFGIPGEETLALLESPKLADKRVHLEVDATAKAWLGHKGYDPLYGARPLARVIQEHIKRPLAEELLFGQLSKGGKVVVTIQDDGPAFECTPANTPALLPPPDDDDLLDDPDDEADDQEFLPEPVA